MSRIVFQPALPVVRSAPNRADIACFIGFVSPRKAAPIPPNIATWLDQQWWMKGDAAKRLHTLLGKPLQITAQAFDAAPKEIKETDILIRDVPIPIDDWAVFDRLFAWNQRTNDPDDGATYLGCAVRSFFGQGGRKCYVISVGPSFPFDTPRTTTQKNNPPSRDDLLGRLVPGYASSEDLIHISPLDRSNWSSIGHLYGLPDVSFICLPDLADLACDPPQPAPKVSAPPPPEEHFVECSTPLPEKKDETQPDVAAPRCDDNGYLRWRKALDSLQAFALQDPLIHEMQLIAAIPMPVEGTDAAGDILGYFTVPDTLHGGDPTSTRPQQFLLFPSLSEPAPRTRAFIQLVYPWLRTKGSVSLPERLESPEGVLAGLLARNALTRGTFNSGTKISVNDVFDIYPPLRPAETETPGLPSPGYRAPMPKRNLVQRVSLFAPTPHGISLISDVTIHPDEMFRPARVNRLVAVIVRAARALGEAHVFDGNSEQTWALVRLHLDELMTSLWAAGALDGDKVEQAFQVACDRSTMTQNDLDNGRMIARIAFTPAASIETITVLLSISAGDTGMDSLAALTDVGVA
jgi:uncharacterized protein